MTGYQYIIEKQTIWAKRNGIQLIGSQGDRGAKRYVPELCHNLFQPLSAEAKTQLLAGNGGELRGDPCKLQAVHSSSAAGINFFDHWISQETQSELVHCLGWSNLAIESIQFEYNGLKIDPMFKFSPNFDLAIFGLSGAEEIIIGIECKLSEPYSSRNHSGIDPKYLELPEVNWRQLSNLRDLARTITPEDQQFKHLHAAQLIKHILALHGNGKFSLLYLWYDTLGPESADHHKEINRFKEVCKADQVDFRSMSYQELIFEMYNSLTEPHEQYLRYISERYL